MKLVYGVSRWTNASRPHTLHIDNGFGHPLCGGTRQKGVFSWAHDEGEPTCRRCIEIRQRMLKNK